MVEQDTIKLLRECNAGIKMGVSSLEDVLDNVKNSDFRKLLENSLLEHNRLGDQTHALLSEYNDEGKEPNMIAKSMSWMKTNVMLLVDEQDHTIADLITDGCNMGVKSLNRYLNQYKAAEEKVKDIAKKLIALEDKLAKDMRDYL